MKKAIDVTLVTHAIGVVREISAELKQKVDVFPYASFGEFTAAHHLAINKLEEHGFRVREDWRGARIGNLGIHSSCTGGLLGAMGNWLRAAEAKIGGAA